MYPIFRTSVIMLLLLSVLTGIAYPIAVTAVAQLCCARQANGSLLQIGDRLVGSSLLGQSFDQPKYFWGRPSATSPQSNNGLASGGSNLGPTNSAQIDAVKARVDTLRAADPGNHASIPVDLVTASASGLDPHISPAAAAYQIARVARVRSLAPERLQQLVSQHTESRQLGVFGEPRINVLELNLALDALH